MARDTGGPRHSAARATSALTRLSERRDIFGVSTRLRLATASRSQAIAEPSAAECDQSADELGVPRDIESGALETLARAAAGLRWDCLTGVECRVRLR